MADEKLEIDVTAKDDASKVIDPLQKKVDQLEKSDPEIAVAADTDTAESDVDSFAEKLKKLSDADQVVVLALRAGAAQSELSQLATDLATIDASDPTVDVKLDRYAEVAGPLDDLEAKMKDIADTSLDPDVGDTARTRLAGITDEAGKAQGAVHSMAGNAIGDFGAAATGIGPLGEAIGQLTETALEGEEGLKGLATAGLGLGAISAGMYVVNRVMGEFAKTAQRAAEIDAFRTAEVDQFTKSLREGNDAAKEWVRTAEQAGKLEGVYSWKSLGGTDVGPQVKTNLIDPLVEAGVTADQFAQVVVGSKADLDNFATALDNAGVSATNQQILVSAARSAAEDYQTAVDNASKFTQAFDTDTQNAGARLDGFTSRLGIGKTKVSDLGTALKGAKDRQDDLSDSTDDATQSLRDQSGVLDGLRTNIDNDQAWIDLANDFDRVKQSGKDAFDAVQSGAEDATQKVRDHDSAINTLKQSIIDYGTKVLGLPPEVVTNIVVNTNDSDLDQTKQKLDDIRQHNKIVIDFVVNSPSGWYLLGSTTKATGPVPGPGTGMAPAPSVVNNYLAAAATGRQLRATSARWSRINGR